MMDKPEWFNRDIIRATTDKEKEAVRTAQLLMRCPINGEMDATTLSHLRGIQKLFGLPVTGCLDAQTAASLDTLRWVETK
jgi:hypothetical protein